ncbi:MAG TPA: DUF3108 domain-containing protein [Pyrinomonadaceae bacterium]|nr:DUF3108 domain-containing protein [Pyrinomonadaceae bacterium]
MRVFAALALLACLCADAAAQARATDVSASPFSAAPYRVGEQLTYNVAFSNFPTAAHVELRVAGRGQFYGREGVELSAHVETTGVVYAALYALNSTYTTYVEPATGLPYRARRNIQEGPRVEDVTREFNAPVGTSAIPPAQTAGGSFGSFDFVSALYRIRALPLTPGATYTLLVQNGSTVYDAEVRVKGRELVKTNVGSSNAVVAQVHVRGNEAADDYRVRVYFTDDERHVPVLITARHRVGEIRAELASAEILTETPAAPGAVAPAQPSAPGQPGTTPPPGPSGVTPPAPAGTGATPDAAAPPLPDLPFKPGEQLNFNFFLGANQQPVGTASFQVRARARYYNRDGLLLSASLQTTGPGAALFPVNDQANSYVDAATVLPFRTELSLQEGTRRARWVVSSDQNGGVALFDDGTRVDIPVGTHDLLSVFYALRSLDLTPGKRTAVSLIVNKRPRQLSVASLRRATIMLGSTQVSAVEVALSLEDTRSGLRNLRVWLSTDRRALPLRITADTPLGPLRADLAIIPTSLQ